MGKFDAGFEAALLRVRDVLAGLLIAGPASHSITTGLGLSFAVPSPIDNGFRFSVAVACPASV
jgi:hypothetical protein